MGDASKGLGPERSSGPASAGVRRHRALSGTDSAGYSGATWRAQQRALVEQGRFDQAMRTDIDDVRARCGTTYDAHLKETVDSLPDDKELQEFLDSNGWSVDHALPRDGVT